MDIPSVQPTTPDIFSYGFSKGLERVSESTGTPTVYDSMQEGINAAQVLAGGNLNLKTLSIGGLIKQVAPGDDIQAAIDAVNREGGGTIQLQAGIYLLQSSIIIKSNVSIIGAGIGITVIDFNSGSYNLGVPSGGSINFILKQFTVQNSASSFAIDLEDCTDFIIESLKVTNCATGIYLYGCSRYSCQDIYLYLNSAQGITIAGANSHSNLIGRFANCYSQANGGIGFSINAGTDDLYYITFVGCTANGNSGDGFDFDASGTSYLNTTLTGCTSISNLGIGFDSSVFCHRVRFLGCFAMSNSDDGFEVGGAGCTMIGCQSSTPYDIDNNALIFIGNEVAYGATVDPKTQIIIANSGSQSMLNTHENTRTIYRTMTMQNTSGSTLRLGNVTVLKSVASGDQVDTTTTNGDNKIFGMVNSTIENNEWGPILKEGYTNSLLVSNGSASIVIGDWLATYSHAYYAKKAVAGDTIFAIALSTPTTSTASISALLVSPRLI